MFVSFIHEETEAQRGAGKIEQGVTPLRAGLRERKGRGLGRRRLRSGFKKKKKKIQPGAADTQV